MSTIKVADAEWKRTNSGKKYLLVTDSDDDRYSVWDKDIANYVAGRVGQKITVEIKSSGDFRRISGVEGLGDERDASDGAEQEQPRPWASSRGNGGMNPDRERRIVRQNALSHATATLAILAQLSPDMFKGQKLGFAVIAGAEQYEAWIYGENATESAPSRESQREGVTTTDTASTAARQSNVVPVELAAVARLFNKLGGAQAVEILKNALGEAKPLASMNAAELAVAKAILEGALAQE